MRRFCLFLILALPLTAAAQNYSKAPLLVVKPEQERPAAPPTPPAPATPEAPPRPAAPESPPHPVSKLWPRDAIPIFMVSCTKFHPELVDPCSCIITKVMTQFTHDEFMRISDANAIESDPRLMLIRQQCISEIPQQKRRSLQDGH